MPALPADTWTRVVDTGTLAEGPVWDDRSGCWWFSVMESGWIWRIDGDRAEPAVHTGDAPNGIALDADGLVYCAQATAGLSRVTPGRPAEIVVSGAFNSPNDLVWFAGELAFSDPTYGLNYSGATARPTAVYAWNGETTRVVLDDVVQPNGLAAGVDGTVYVTDSGTQQVHRVAAVRGSEWTVEKSVTLPSDRPGVVDGLAHWRDTALLLVTGPGGVWFLEDTTLVAVAHAGFGEKVTNIAIDATGGTALLTTHSGATLGDLRRLRAALAR